MEQNFVVGTILLADELERSVQRLDRSLERAFNVAPPQPQLVDVALDFLEASLGFLEEQVGTPLRFTDDQFGLGLRGLLDLVGEPLSGEQRISQVGFTFAMLGKESFLPHEILAEAINLAQRVLVVVGGFGEKRDDFGSIEAAQLRAEALLLQIDWRDAHDAISRRRAGAGGRGAGWRLSAIEHGVLA